MRTSRRVVVVVSMGIVALGLGQMWRARSASSLARAALVAVQKRTVVLEAELLRAAHRKSLPAPDPEKLGRQIPENGEPKTVNAAEAPGRVAGPDASHLVATHPAIAAEFERAFRAQFANDYGSLYKRLGLSREQVERFEQRLFQDQLDKLDLSWIARTQGLKRDDPVLENIRQQQDAAMDTDLRTILGADGYEGLERFRRANGARPFVNDLATAMTLSECAMTREQQDRLLQVIADASARYQQGGRAMPWDVNWDSVMAQAPEFLYPNQLVSLRVNGDQYVRFVWMLPQFYEQRTKSAK